MAPAERTALRELVAKATQANDEQSHAQLSVAGRYAILTLLDDCERLERERDEARHLLRCVEDADDESYSSAWRAVDEAITRWVAEDAQAKKEGGG